MTLTTFLSHQAPNLSSMLVMCYCMNLSDQQLISYVLLQKDVDAVGQWSTINHLKFNPTKCKAMVFSRKDQLQLSVILSR